MPIFHCKLPKEEPVFQGDIMTASCQKLDTLDLSLLYYLCVRDKNMQIWDLSV